MAIRGRIALYTVGVKNIADNIERRYDPENDTIPGAPSVTWADYQLVNFIEYLEKIVDAIQQESNLMQKEIDDLQKKISKLQDECDRGRGK